MSGLSTARRARTSAERALVRVFLGVVVGLALVFWLIQYAALARYAIEDLHLNDFGKFYYSAAFFLEGREMYGPSPATDIPITATTSRQFWNLNPPHFHLLVLPLTALSPRAALGVWAVANLLALVLSFHLITRAVRLRWSLWGVMFAISAVVFASATSAVVITGQVTFLLMLGFTLAWIAARRDRWTQAAWLLGLLASVKPLFGIFWLYLLWRRQFRAGAIMAGTAVLTGLVGLAVFGWENYRAWFEALRSVDWTWATMNGSLQGLLARTFGDNAYFVPLVEAPGLVLPLWALGAVLTMALTLHLVAADASVEATDRAFVGLLVTALLVSPLGWIYYLWLIAGPVTALWLSLAARPSTARDLVLLAAVPGLVWPYPLAGWFRLEPWMGATGGSVYSWTTLALWTALILDWRVRSTPPVATELSGELED